MHLTIKKSLLITAFIFLFTLNIGNICKLSHSNVEQDRNIVYKQIINKIESESDIQIPNYVSNEHIKFMFKTAIILDLPIRLVFRLIHKESNFKSNAESTKGAMGFMQIMPPTYREYNKLLNLDDLELDYNSKNILIGMNYLKNSYLSWLSKGYDSKYSWRLALASYNAGVGNVIKHKLKYNNVQSIPYKTRDFVNFILN